MAAVYGQFSLPRAFGVPGVVDLSAPNWEANAPSAGASCPAPPPPPPPPPTPSTLCGPTGSQWTTEADDFLRLRTWTTDGPRTVDFYGRATVGPETLKPYTYPVTGNSPTVPSESITATGKGCISSIAASVNGGLLGATVYLLAELGKKIGGVFLPHTELLSGLLTDQGVAGIHTTPPGGGGGSAGCSITGGSVDFTTGANNDFVTIPAPPAGMVTRVTTVLFDLDTLACVADVQYRIIAGGLTQAGWGVNTSPYVTLGLAQAGILVEMGAVTGKTGIDNWWVSLPFPIGFTEEIRVIVLPQDGDLNAIISAGYVTYIYTSCCC
jgi:hypothetical protein